MHPQRLLEHGASECISNNPLFQGLEIKPGEGGINERGQVYLRNKNNNKNILTQKNRPCWRSNSYQGSSRSTTTITTTRDIM